MKEVCFFSCTKSERIKGSSAYKAEGPFLVWRKKEPGNMWEVVDKKKEIKKKEMPDYVMDGELGEEYDYKSS